VRIRFISGSTPSRRSSIDTIVILLTNRVHPTPNTPNFSLVRSVVADAVMRSLFPDAEPREVTAGR